MNDLNDSRLRTFRQVRIEIRGSTEHLIVGVDIANHVWCMGWCMGSPI